MFFNKFNYKKIPYRNYKSLKLMYQSNLIKNCFLQNKFILFYYYNIISIDAQKNLENILIAENLKYYKIKGNILNKILLDSNLNNLIKNNVLIIFNPTLKESNFNYTQFTKKLNFKSIHFFGIWLNNQFLRPSELKKLQILSKINPIKKTIYILKLKEFLIKKSLTLKKF